MFDEHTKMWMEVERDETMALLRKKLEELNDMDPDDLDHEDVHMIKDIYETLDHIMSIEKDMPK